MIPQLQASPTPVGAPGAGSTLIQFLWIPIVIGIFYFLVMAPARKKQVKMQEMLDSLKNGDRVITTGGIYGTVVKVNKEESSLRLRIAPSVEIDVTRASVAGLQSEPSQGS